MPQLTEQQLSAFKNLAVEQGHDPGEVNAFLQTASAFRKPREEEEEAELGEVADLIKRTGDFESVADAFKLGSEERIDLFNKLQTEEGLPETPEGVLEERGVSDEGLSIPGLFAEKKELSEADEKASEFATGLGNSAQNLLDVLGQIESGALQGQAAEDALNFAAAAMEKSAFTEGGKQLTAKEQALLQGLIPTIEQREQNIIQKMTGRVPPQTARVLDSPQTLQNKARLAIGLRRQVDARLAGEESPQLVDELVKQSFDIQQDEDGLLTKAGRGIFNLTIRPILQGAKAYAEHVGVAAGTLALPTISKVAPQFGRGLADTLEPILEERYSSPTKTLMTGGLSTLAGVGATIDVATLGRASTAKNLAKTTLKLGARNMAINAPIFGVGEALKSIRTGDTDNLQANVFRGMTGQSTIGPFQGAYGKNDLTQTADVVTTIIVPILGQPMLEKAMSGSMFKEPSQPKLKNKINDAFETPKKVGATMGLKFKAAERTSVAEAEDLAQKTIAMTKSNSIRGMAREMPKWRKAGLAYTRSTLKQADEVGITFTEDETAQRILRQVKNTSSAQANPKLFNRFKEVLLRELSAKSESPMELTGVEELPENMRIGEIKPSNLDNVRTSFNRALKKGNWFRNGMPTKSRTDNMMAMKWVASNVIKDIFAGNSETVNALKGIKVQHVTYATEPILSNTVLSTKRPIFGGGVGQAFVNTIRNAIDAIVTPIRISGLRQSLQDLPIAQDVRTIEEALPENPSNLFQ